MTISTITLAKLPLNGGGNLTTTALSLAGLLFSIHVLQTKNLTENMHQGMLKATDPNVKGTVFLVFSLYCPALFLLLFFDNLVDLCEHFPHYLGYKYFIHKQ
ncbi:hypothetical protein AFK71_17205 [Virgibacillus pantothenticus]|uniref:Uncharacterized protein n=1 Tax=Virgibacillus pantothenticus TaxID=1473 RepID=A0A0L0QPH8_VIRPA|nr:hypothetical protein AFK71_17205 [Virgibacillus pantothenticus]